MTDDQYETGGPPITELSSRQRRVLGVLVEKGITTPEYYPLTLKALTAGCNQKSNRDPVVEYSEEQVAETLDELRELGLAAVIHTESGRTERYRHYMRRRFTLTEPQLAILTELLLRGRQQLGELRTRASRMVPIDGLDQLREELAGLQSMNLVQASGPLERRGVDVDHTLYREKEARTLATVRETGRDAGESESAPAARQNEHPVSAADVTAATSPDAVQRLTALETTVAELRMENRDLRSELESVRDELRDLRDRLDASRGD